MFFFEAVAVPGDQAFNTATRLTSVFKSDLERLTRISRDTTSASDLHRHFQSHPVGSVRDAHKTLHLSIPTLHSAAKHLVSLGILKELHTSGKTHLFAYQAYLEILNDDAGSL